MHRARVGGTAGSFSDRGIALPMALLTLCIIATLTAVFATLGRTEPAIATNHLRSAQARMLADSGIEHVLWALDHATEPGGFGGTGTPPDVVLGAPTAPFDGSRFVRAGAWGGFFVTVTGSDQRVRVARSIGISPDAEGPAARTSARSEVVATAVRIRGVPREAPCAVCVAPPLTLSAPLTVDSRGSAGTDCGAKIGAATGGDLAIGASVALFGAGAPANEPPANVEGRDWAAGQTTPTLSGDDLDTLKALAFARGMYVRPAPDTLVDLVGAPDGLVFVDTPAGTNVIGASNRAIVAIRPGFSAGAPFRGWIVVNGDVALEGHFGEIAGLLYAANVVTAHDTAGARITGMLIAAGVLGGPAVTLGDLSVVFDCASARGSGLLPSGWFVRPGAYCDQPSGC